MRFRDLRRRMDQYDRDRKEGLTTILPGDDHALTDLAVTARMVGVILGEAGVPGATMSKLDTGYLITWPDDPAKPDGAHTCIVVTSTPHKPAHVGVTITEIR